MMVASATFLIVGSTLTFVGMVMLLFSLRPMKGLKSKEQMGMELIFLGPIPIILVEKGKLAIIGIVAATMFGFLLVVMQTRPDLIAW